MHSTVADDGVQVLANRINRHARSARGPPGEDRLDEKGALPSMAAKSRPMMVMDGIIEGRKA